MKALANLCSKLLLGQIPQHTRDLLFAANLTALRKKDVGIRPIAVGNVFRRLASKIAAKRVIPELRRQLPPVQLGVGVSGGCEAAAHAFRAFVQSSDVHENNVLIKLDMQNAFNTVRRDHFLEVCSSRAPSILHLASTAYATSSNLVIGNETILSETGVQQDDPLGPVLFALAVDEIAWSVRSPINIWYLDDATISVPVESVCEDLRRIIPMLSDIGLEVNPTKSEVSNVFCDNFQSVLIVIESALPGVTVTESEDLNILGAPIDINGCRTGVLKAVERLSTMSSRLESIDAHPAFFLLRNCLSMLRLLFKLRSSPCYRLHAELTQFDKTLRQATSTVCNVKFDDTGWQQSTLPVAQGRLGLSSAVNVSLPAYASSLSATRQLVGQILQDVFEPCPTSEVDSVAELGQELITTDKKLFQRYWSSAVHKALFHSIKAGAPPSRLARILTAAQGHSGDWITAYPIAQVGTRLDDETLQISVALRVGLNVCLAHQCRCGATVQSDGLHPLSCRFSAGRFPRHSAINNIIKRSHDTAGLHSILEPVGLDRGYGRRPDGVTSFPFKCGKALAWDATCTDSFSASNLYSTILNPGSESSAAEYMKRQKYSQLMADFVFVPVAVETSGIIGSAGCCIRNKKVYD